MAVVKQVIHLLADLGQHRLEIHRREGIDRAWIPGGLERERGDLGGPRERHQRREEVAATERIHHRGREIVWHDGRQERLRLRQPKVAPAILQRGQLRTVTLDDAPVESFGQRAEGRARRYVRQRSRVGREVHGQAGRLRRRMNDRRRRR